MDRPADHGIEWRAVLKVLGFGLATTDSGGLLLSVDDRFLQLHGFDPSEAGVREQFLGHRLAEALRTASGSAAPGNGDPLSSTWELLLDDPQGTGEGRTDVRLADGRTMEIATTPAPGRMVVLVVRESIAIPAAAERLMLQRSLAHEVNNALGGMLANLYLALSDIENAHPARGWVQTVNDAVMDLRSRIRKIVT